MDKFYPGERQILSADRRQEWWTGLGATAVVCGGAFFGWLVLSEPQNEASLADTVLPAADAATLLNSQFSTGAGPLPSGRIVLAAADMTAPTPLAHADIMKVQLKLKALGFDPGTADGRAGPHTLNALNAYRKSLGLKPSTAVDRQAVAPLTP
jgi:peptidoglycan hydrolase-like protein with peptidoglycan-binding domain